MTKSAGTRPCLVEEPGKQTVPLVFSSPHSGRYYPARFLRQTRLTSHELRRSEDAHVDDLYDFVPELGAPFIKATYARSYLDPNREPMELDPEMFADRLPEGIKRDTERVAAGFGIIPRLASQGLEIYDRKILFQKEKERLSEIYQPYHEVLAGLIANTRDKFGWAVLIDCHSMPSLEPRAENVPGHETAIRGGLPRDEPDFVLGDCYGESCAPELTALAEERISSFGYGTRRNNPYSGGYCTRHYGRPGDHIHALQIEISRSLYWDEKRLAVRPGPFARLRRHLRAICETLVTIDLGERTARAAE